MATNSFPSPLRWVPRVIIIDPAAEYEEEVS